MKLLSDGRIPKLLQTVVVKKRKDLYCALLFQGIPDSSSQVGDVSIFVLCNLSRRKAEMHGNRILKRTSSAIF